MNGTPRFASSQTVVDERGWSFQLPPLGVPNPAGEWVAVRAAIGKREASARLLLDRTADAPLRHPDGEYSTKENEYEDAIWFLPLLPSDSLDTKPYAFTLNIHRIRISAAPPAERVQIPIPIRILFYNPVAQRLECTPDILGLGNPSSLQDSELMRICLDPTPSQCDPRTLAATIHGDPTSMTAAQLEKRKDEVEERAYEAMSAMSSNAVSETWLREIFQDAVAAGLRNSPIFNEHKPIFKLRVSHEPDMDVRGLDYALVREDDFTPPLPQDWLPVPSHAFTPDFVRGSVNLFRFGIGKRLFTKAEWPPPPTTLMRIKGGA